MNSPQDPLAPARKMCFMRFNSKAFILQTTLIVFVLNTAFADDMSAVARSLERERERESLCCFVQECFLTVSP